MITDHKGRDTGDAVTFSRDFLLSFDDVETGGSIGRMPKHYGGVTWSNAYALDTVGFGIFGHGVTSGTQVAFNAGGDPMDMTSTAGSFDLESLNLSAGWVKRLDVEILGYVDGVLKFSRTVLVNNQESKHVELGWNNVDHVHFSSTVIKIDPRILDVRYNIFLIDDLEIADVRRGPDPTPPAAAFSGGSHEPLALETLALSHGHGELFPATALV